MAECGVASRRKCEEMITAGRVKVNGKTVAVQGVQVNPAEDSVEVDGRVISRTQKKVYLMLNKPKGVVTTASDQFGRKTVLDLVDCSDRIFPVGRLDYDTEGLLLLTNDGAFAYRMTHPGHRVDKRYRAVVSVRPDEGALERLRRGVVIDGKKTAPAKAEWKDGAVELTICEGRNRQVRKMLSAIGHPVLELKRLSVGTLVLGGLPVGQWRYLTDGEVKRLCRTDDFSRSGKKSGQNEMKH